VTQKDVSAVVIINSKSGKRGNADTLLQQLESAAASLGVKCRFVRPRSAEELAGAAREAARSDHDVVIAAGGDGTVNAVAHAMVGTGKRFGVLPLGTFNYFAREMGVPLDVEAAFRACFEGETRSVSVGEVNGHMFLNNASIGMYPVILAVREQIYRRWGRSRFLAYVSVMTTLLRFQLNMDLTLTLNGERRRLRTPLLFVARSAFQLEEFNVPGVRCINEDGFSVYALRPLRRLDLLGIAWRTFAGKLKPRYDFTMACTNAMRVESRRILRTLAFDGERVKILAPLEFQVHVDALRVAVPRAQNEAAA
jgi:diacylglycerol kinase family enzyme